MKVVTESAAPGSSTTIHVKLDEDTDKEVHNEVLKSAKDTLLSAAEKSQHTYILGYEAEPFEDIPETSGFTATIGSVPVHMQDSACWETFQKGACSSPGICLWCHPMASNLSPLSVQIE